MTKPVIPSSLLGVGENRVGFRRILESVFGLTVIRVLVRVVLEGQAPVGTLYFLFSRRTRDAQNLVVVTFTHRLIRFTLSQISILGGHETGLKPALTGRRLILLLASGSLQFRAIQTQSPDSS